MAVLSVFRFIKKGGYIYQIYTMHLNITTDMLNNSMRKRFKSKTKPSGQIKWLHAMNRSDMISQHSS